MMKKKKMLIADCANEVGVAWYQPISGRERDC